MSFFEETNPSDIAFSQVFQSIKLHIPKIEERDIKFLYHGTYNVFSAMDRFIFRFPDIDLRNSKGVQLIKREAEVLRILSSNLDIPIPNPVFISTNENNPFMGYKKLNGVSLNTVFNHVPVSERIEIAIQIGSFLSQLHSPELCRKLAQTIDIGFQFSYQEFQDEWKNTLEEAKKLVFPKIKKHQKEWTISLFNDFLEEDHFNFLPCIVHGDFDITNILVNPTTYEVIGIIDFEECRIYDPAVDLLFFIEGDEFLQALIENYQWKIDESFKSRMRFYFSRTFLPYLSWGIRYNKQTMIKYGLKILEDRMSQFP
jgi:aminoglycoside 2''-phosphotransferase